MVIIVGKSSTKSVARKEGEKLPKLAINAFAAWARLLNRAHFGGIQTHPAARRGQSIFVREFDSFIGCLHHCGELSVLCNDAFWCTSIGLLHWLWVAMIRTLEGQIGVLPVDLDVNITYAEF